MSDAQPTPGTEENVEKHVGSSEPKRDGDRYVTGRARFVADRDVPNGLHMGVVRSTHAHANIVSIDTSEIETDPAVERVLTGEDTAELMEPIPHFVDPAVYGGKHPPVPALAIDKVRYTGQPVAVVLATSKYEAREARDRVDVEYDPLDVVLNAEEAMESNSPVVVDGWDDNMLFEEEFSGGDPEAAFEEADNTLSERIEIHRYTTQPIELRAYIAEYDEGDEHLTLYGTAQNPHPLRSVVAGALKLRENQVEIEVPNLGGGFGMKMHSHPESSLVSLLSKLSKKRVKWVEDRSDQLLVGGREQTHDIEVAFDDDGDIVGFNDALTCNIGAPYPTPGWGMVYTALLTLPTVYDIDHGNLSARAIVTNKGPWNATRGFGKPGANAAVERTIELIADELDMDPTAVRRKNLITSDQFPYKNIPGLNYDSGDYETVMDKTLDLADYEAFRERQAEAREEDRYIGIGMAFEMTPEGATLPGVLVGAHDTARLTVDPSGSVTVFTGVTDPGSGNSTAISQIVADELGLDPEDVRVVQGDTDACPYGFGNYAGRSTISGGGAAKMASEDVAGQLRETAAALIALDAQQEGEEPPDIGPDDLTLSDGTVHPIGAPADEGLPLPDVAHAVYAQTYAFVDTDIEPPVESTKTHKPGNIDIFPDEEGKINPYPSYSNGFYVAQVEVDPETGVVDVDRFCITHDCGNMINPQQVEGQSHGAAAFGIGGAMMEETPYDEDGVPQAGSLGEYLLPRASDLPAIEVDHNVTPHPFSEQGTKGAGESGVGGSFGAIVNAVNDAIEPFGGSINAFPVKPPTVKAAIDDGEGGES
jgi:carbon-monoxide dehydrogenase large subunit